MTTWPQTAQNRVLAPETLTEQVAQLRGQGKTIATLNGAFDLLHPGHAFMIHEAAATADILIVALNADASISRAKGPGRPLLRLEERLQLVGAMKGVDFVTWFSEPDPRALLEMIRPDVHVNGEEYGPECIEAEVVKRYGGRLHLVPRLPQWATTRLVEKIATCV